MDPEADPPDAGARRPTRRRPRLTLRLLLVLVLLMGIGMGLPAHRARRQRRAVDAVRRAGGQVAYDWEFLGGKRTPGRGPGGPAWLRRAIGDEFFQQVVEVDLTAEGRPGLATEDPTPALADLGSVRVLKLRGDRAGDRALAAVATMSGLEELTLDDPEASPAAFAGLGVLRRLRRLSIDFPDASPDRAEAALGAIRGMRGLVDLTLYEPGPNAAGIAGLRSLASLQRLSIYYPEAPPGWTDAALTEVEAMVGLTDLELWFDALGDRGLSRLRGLRGLRRLNLTGGEITDEGLGHVGDLAGLEHLIALGGKITDEGLEQLWDLKSLKSLLIGSHEGWLSREGLQDLRRHLPALTVLKTFGTIDQRPANWWSRRWRSGAHKSGPPPRSKGASSRL